jgi:hypothetical protein
MGRCLNCNCIGRHSVAKPVCPHCCKSVCAYMLQSEPYSARGHFCQCCKACVSTLLQVITCCSRTYSARGHFCQVYCASQCYKACVSKVLQKCMSLCCCSRSRTVPGATSARWSATTGWSSSGPYTNPRYTLSHFYS